MIPACKMAVAARRIYSRIQICEDNCWIWTGAKTPRGYGSLSLFGKAAAAHRVSFELSHGEIKSGQCVMHSCDNPACINPAHLSQGTQKENCRDASDKNRTFSPVGSRSGLAKINESQAIAAMEMMASGKTRRQIAAIFGISRDTITKIRAGVRWPHLQPQIDRIFNRQPAHSK